MLAIHAADCVPILVSNGSEVAAIHAGWRGLVAGVIEATLRQMVANECVAVVGPCIAVEKYEVGGGRECCGRLWRPTVRFSTARFGG